MGKYIDSEKLIAEIQDRRREFINKGEQDLHDAEIIRRSAISSYNDFLSLITSLRQEQPEVDLEKEIDDYMAPIQPWKVQEAPFTSLENCARHFYELGLNARKL